MTKPLIAYHAGCKDGFTAAWSAWQRFEDEAVYVSMSYGDDTDDFHEFVAGRPVFVLDFSFPREEMEEMADKAEKFVVLDHHETAKEDCEGLDFCHFDLDKSGARLAWEYFCESQTPKIVEYVEDRDLWNWELEHSRDVNAAIQSYDITEKPFEQWQKFFQAERKYFPRERGPGKLASEGRAIRRSHDQFCDILEEQTAQTLTLNNVEINGLSTSVEVVAANSPVLSSEAGHRMAKKSESGVGAVWYLQSDGRIKVSLRATEESDIHVGKLAENYGGGGHEEAAGFVTSIESFQGSS